ncbi:hypothetical protein EMIT048CA2_90098 [Pseudomonas chlororaphis]
MWKVQPDRITKANMITVTRTMPIIQFPILPVIDSGESDLVQFVEFLRPFIDDFLGGSEKIFGV